MTRQFSTTVRNAIAGTLESTIGPSPTLEIRNGSIPVDTAAADTGTLLVSIALPADWLGSASSGAVSSTASWTGTASATGTPTYYRIKASGVAHEQGTVTATGGGGDMTLDDMSITALGVVTIPATSYQFGVGGA